MKMKTKSVFFNNPFARVYVSLKTLVQISKEFINQLILIYPDDRYQHMKLDTEAVMLPASEFLTEKVDSLSEREGETLNVNLLLKDFKSVGISQVEGTIRGKYGKNSQKYKEFFPNGIIGYTQISKSSLDIMLEHLINTFEKYASDFDASYITIVREWYNQYKNARIEQMNKKSEVISLKNTQLDVRTALENQMFKNLLQISMDHFDNLDKASSFFNFSLLKRSRSNKADGSFNNIHNITILALSTVEAGIRFDEETIFQFFNDSDIAVQIYTGSSLDTICPINAHVLEAYKEVKINAIDLGKAINRYLFIKNNNTEKEANIEISIE